MKTLYDMLPFVEQPSRYLGNEINRIKKHPDSVRLRVALAFPDLYEIGTSHFGMQILYHILNRQPELAAERVFAPAIDMEDQLRAAGVPLTSLESRTPLNRFDIIGFSLLYELNYSNILTILDLAGIPFLASERDDSHPLIIAGGPCACNPEPFAELFDAVVIGDGEDVILKLADAAMVWKADGATDKSALLKQWSEIEGVYIPLFFSAAYDESGFQKIVPQFPNYTGVTRTILPNIDAAPFPDAPVIPFGRPVHDRLRIEIARGCVRGCRFCQAGMIYRPVRERSVETLIELAERSLAATGYEDLSLLSLSTGDYSCIAPLMESLMAAYESKHVAVSFPSLRAETLTPELMELIKRVRKTGFTIAPEAGTQRLRDVINKNLTDQEIISTVHEAFDLGWQVIKLYFMIGLPTETDADLEAIVKLVKEMKGKRGKGAKGQRGKGKLNVSIGTFIPKPHTPFQWAAQMPLSESKEKIRWLQDSLKLPGVDVKWQRPEVSWLEGLWARGDRRLTRLLITAWRKGCKFDGWSDKFRYDLWKEACAEQGIDPDFYTTRKRDISEPLPWDHIDMRISKDFLKSEWEKAMRGETTLDCRTVECNACGVCNGNIENKLQHSRCVQRSLSDKGIHQHSTCNMQHSFKLSYSKTGAAAFFGHLELVNIILRALRRAGIRLKYSEGFHPLPKVSFDDPLPMGMESLNEAFYLTVMGDVEPETLMNQLNQQLPEGLVVHDCERILPGAARPKPESITYRITLKIGEFNETALPKFRESSECVMTYVNKKGNMSLIDLKERISALKRTAPNQIEIAIAAGPTLRPYEAIRKIFNLTEEEVTSAAVMKLR